MMNQEQSDHLLRLTRSIIDLKMEKKSMNKDFNDRIKNLEAEIAVCVKE
jgi:hypothetical protein